MWLRLCAQAQEFRYGERRQRVSAFRRERRLAAQASLPGNCPVPDVEPAGARLYVESVHRSRTACEQSRSFIDKKRLAGHYSKNRQRWSAVPFARGAAFHNDCSISGLRRR